MQTQHELAHAIEERTGKPVRDGVSKDLVKELVNAVEWRDQRPAAPAGDVAKENANLRGQVAFLRGRLEARGGRDYPPCWADEATGRVQMLFNIELTDSNVVIAPGWPESRTLDAMELPGLRPLIDASPHAYAALIS